MEVAYKRKNKTLIIRVSGEIDHHTSAELRRQAENILMETGGRNIIFDFEEVTFMDSSGIGMMIGRYKQLQAFGGRVAAACANEKIEEIIRLSGIIHLIPVFHTMEDAVSYVEGRESDAV